MDRQITIGQPLQSTHGPMARQSRQQFVNERVLTSIVIAPAGRTEFESLPGHRAEDLRPEGTLVDPSGTRTSLVAVIAAPPDLRLHRNFPNADHPWVGIEQHGQKGRPRMPRPRDVNDTELPCLGAHTPSKAPNVSDHPRFAWPFMRGAITVRPRPEKTQCGRTAATAPTADGRGRARNRRLPRSAATRSSAPRRRGSSAATTVRSRRAR